MEESVEKAAALVMARSLRVQARHLRTIGDMQLSHAAYRSARSVIRSLRVGKDTVAACMCNPLCKAGREYASL